MANNKDQCRRRLIAIAQQIVAESDNAAGFDATAWVDEWLKQPLPAIGGQSPEDYLGAGGTCDLLDKILRQAQSGAYG